MPLATGCAWCETIDRALPLVSDLNDEIGHSPKDNFARGTASRESRESDLRVSGPEI
jgi:hypothetical protein